MRFARRRRKGILAVEAGFTLPVLLFLLLATAVGGYGVFRYQQVAHLARAGARYASVHGAQYEQDTGNPAATAQDVYNNAILPNAVGLDASQLSYCVSWNAGNAPSQPGGDYEKATTNTVTVTVSYQWLPELFLVGPVTLSSSSTVPMSY
jgi:Flp pilus assembly protein TadG